ncbi:MAG: CPBP family intramembrane metalloprotease [Desulfobacterales bacterium]|nr:CPBP family intramembrane metalloprotease [Desulfobacterales bacterium]
MITGSSGADRRQIPFISLVPFLLIAFGLAWGILALFIFLPNQMTEIFGELTGQHPLFFLAVYAPAIAAFIIVTYNAGIGGLRRYLSRLLLWRCSQAWYAFLIVGIPLLFYGGSAWKGNLFTEPFPFPSFQSLLIALLLAAIKGPIEEFGWRGLALPLLQRKLAPIWAALILGVVWGFWHLPAFLLSGTQQSAWSFTPFFAGTVTISLIVTALFNASRGSILLPALMHFQLMNPIWPDAQPYDTYLLVGAAVLVVWFNRKAMFSREGAVTEVIPQAESRVMPRDLGSGTGKAS